MSDACLQALCLDALLEKKIEQAVRGQFSDAEWNAKSKEQQEDGLMTYSSTCHHHIRNVGVAHAEAAVVGCRANRRTRNGIFLLTASGVAVLANVGGWCPD